jgi:hypothetical protein
MNITLQATFEDYKLKALFDALGPSNRSRLLSVGAKAMEVLARRHLGRVAPTRHATASALGATPTGHIRKGISRIVSTATPEYGEVTLPIPGIGRAWRDIDLSTPTRRGSAWYTIPKHRAAYGRSVADLRRLGWKIFRPGKKKILLGYRQKGSEPVLLYALAKKVHQPCDPSLLPGKGEFMKTFAGAIGREVTRRLRAAAANNAEGAK